MSWIKPNFMWMMYRSGWGQKPGQEIVLAIRLRRPFFEEILAAAIHSSHEPRAYASRSEWKARLDASEVRLQWDPDHAPDGSKLERRAIQLGLRGGFLARFAKEELLGIEDISPLVRQGRDNMEAGEDIVTPREDVLVPTDQRVTQHLGLAEQRV